MGEAEIVNRENEIAGDCDLEMSEEERERQRDRVCIRPDRWRRRKSIVEGRNRG